MTADTITNIIALVLTASTSAAAWNFYARRQELRAARLSDERADDAIIREDLRERIVHLERNITQLHREKDELARELAKLAAQVAEYRARMECLELDNQRLKTSKP